MPESETTAPVVDPYIAEYAKLSNAQLAKKIRHLERTIKRGIRTGFLQRNIDRLVDLLGIAVAEANRR